ncbi:MAG: 3-dehydroquinate synthase [Bacteroidales bacterium]|nr:3-dehydroquinate synthase [Bacteroidales bacterium]
MPIQKYTLSDHTNIFVGNDANDMFSEFLTNELPRFSSLYLLTDSNTRHQSLPLLQSWFGLPQNIVVLEIDAGEQHKTLETCRKLWVELAQNGADRHSLLMCLGGGVVCDLGGFVASTYQRGMSFLFLPTSLLAQVDASIGGKTGIDLDGLKNYIGLFSNPLYVFIFPEFLRTLPFEQLLSGFAEVVKQSLIEGRDNWEFVKSHFPKPDSLCIFSDWQEVIKRSISTKHRIVESDPTEKGLRKVLNFGHTVAHALETFSLRNDPEPLLHGHAVAMGMLVELQLSVQLLGFPIKLADEIAKYLLSFYPLYKFNQNVVDQIIELMLKDKKNKKLQLKMTLLNDLGQPVIDYDCSLAQVRRFLGIYFNLTSSLAP